MLHQLLEIISTISAIAAIIAAIVIAKKQNKLSKQIANNQIAQTERQIKINLYEKRLEVYKCFVKYWNDRNLLFEANLPPIPSVSNFEILVQDIFLPLGREKNIDNIYIFVFINEEINKITSSYFLLSNKEIAKNISDYVTNILKFALTVKTNCWKKDKLINLQKMIKNFEENRILEKIESEILLD